MPTKNHKHSMSQQERAFWREAFLTVPAHSWGLPMTLAEELERRSEFADAAIAEYRKRITWRQP